MFIRNFAFIKKDMLSNLKNCFHFARCKSLKYSTNTKTFKPAFYGYTTISVAFSSVFVCLGLYFF